MRRTLTRSELTSGRATGAAEIPSAEERMVSMVMVSMVKFIVRRESNESNDGELGIGHAPDRYIYLSHRNQVHMLDCSAEL